MVLQQRPDHPRPCSSKRASNCACSSSRACSPDSQPVTAQNCSTERANPSSTPASPTPHRYPRQRSGLVYLTVSCEVRSPAHKHGLPDGKCREDRETRNHLRGQDRRQRPRLSRPLPQIPPVHRHLTRVQPGKNRHSRRFTDAFSHYRRPTLLILWALGSGWITMQIQKEARRGA